MFRPVARLAVRPSALRTIPRAAAPARRFLSTVPPTQKSRSWKSLAARLSIAGAVIYYYNTTEVFAEEPRQVVHTLPETDEETELLPTVEDVAKERQQRKAELIAAQEKEAASAQETTAAPASGVEQLEEEADQQGAFNPETGEINWDCPCLGGMAHGPCGEEFKAAFSCFVFSTEEPKGMDCIEKFKGMQNCFRQYPEVYGAELESDEEDDLAADMPQPEGEPAQTTETSSTEHAKPAPQPQSSSAKDNQMKKDDRNLVPEAYRPSADPATERAKAAAEQVKQDHELVDKSERIIPKAAHDEREANEAKK